MLPGMRGIGKSMDTDDERTCALLKIAKCEAIGFNRFDVVCFHINLQVIGVVLLCVDVYILDLFPGSRPNAC